MEYPTPDDPARAPVWENYVTAQGAAAALRLVPPYAHALGVEVEGNDVVLVVQVPPGAPERDEDIDDIVLQLEVLLGDAVTVRTRTDVRPECTLSPTGGANDRVRWFFASRYVGEDQGATAAVLRGRE
ncbi:hypothetical protein [Cellulomonas cellasea]|uniref:Uncharacterized protein n=1 Tax=Cellulomonas cellasea TaxID=43670 RepID=A0A7W4YC68_9CELL|nr:hypothetical protein [Cellulomonas cellasea]MBB2923231.1 hypothetical protein [Cellulomonas cellasea]